MDLFPAGQAIDGDAVPTLNEFIVRAKITKSFPESVMQTIHNSCPNGAVFSYASRVVGSTLCVDPVNRDLIMAISALALDNEMALPEWV